jgi:hypothetical protein
MQGRGAAERAGRLVRWYPRSWRAHYGEEFVALLVAEIEERPRAWRRTADVARGGVLARLSHAGLAGQLREPADQVRSSLAWLAGALGVFLVLGAAMGHSSAPAAGGLAPSRPPPSRPRWR